MPAKKTTTRKSAAKPRAAATTTARSATKRSAKRTVGRRVSARSGSYSSFRLARRDRPFMTVHIGHQSVYWSIIGVMIITLAAWTAYQQVRISQLYDEVHSSYQYINTLPAPKPATDTNIQSDDEATAQSESDVEAVDPEQ